jgi:hypothetical protein
MKTAPILLAAALAVASPLSVAAANLVSNGSFESFTGTFGNQIPGDGVSRVDPGSSAITDWSVVGPNNIALGTIPNSYNASTPFGSIAVDLTGYGSSGLATLRQTVSGLTIGTTYEATFWLGLIEGRCGIGGNGNCDGPNSATATISGATFQTFPFTIDVGTPQPGRLVDTLTSPTNGSFVANRIWEPKAFQFVADDSSIGLGFQAGLSGPNNAFLGLDNISVQAVPAPAAGPWLLLSGFALMAMLQRRRTQG